MIRLLISLMAFALFFELKANSKPNIIIVITDDQGYGDFSFSGNPIVKTPHIDKFKSEATTLTNYHVDPTCAPTRSALMTGRYSARVGVWHTVQGRHLMREREVTMPEILADNGYNTAIFGKWHLGDAYPYRPEDRGFNHVVMHAAGGVGQGPDFWGNDYFNDTYYIDGQYKKYEGFCTDVWFAEAEKFIRKNAKAKKPFFAYISTNAPHSPYRAPKKYIDMYHNIKEITNKKQVPFYAMITNIDDRFSDLRKTLQELKIEDNTILIYTTDNGSAAGSKLYNNGRKGAKNSNYDGGHRVPFIVRWPKGHILSHSENNQLTAHFDILPTFIKMLNLKAPQIDFDGQDISKLFLQKNATLPSRTLMVESQRKENPSQWKLTAVMNQDWRLVNANELYKIAEDPGQTNNLAKEYPEIVQQLTKDYEQMWASLAAEHHIFSPLYIGAKEENPVRLQSHDQMTKGATLPYWHQSHVLKAKNLLAPWVVYFVEDANYEFSLRRWPAEVDRAINEQYLAPKSIGAVKAFIQIGDLYEEKEVSPQDKEITFSLNIKKGQDKLTCGFIDAQGNKSSAFYTYVLNTKLGKKEAWQTRKGLNLPLVTSIEKDYREYPNK